MAKETKKTVAAKPAKEVKTVEVKPVVEKPTEIKSKHKVEKITTFVGQQFERIVDEHGIIIGYRLDGKEVKGFKVAKATKNNISKALDAAKVEDKNDADNINEDDEE